MHRPNKREKSSRSCPKLGSFRQGLAGSSNCRSSTGPMCDHSRNTFERGRDMNLQALPLRPVGKAAEVWENSHEVSSFPCPGLSVRLAVLGEIAGGWRPKRLSDRVSDVLSGM